MYGYPISKVYDLKITRLLQVSHIKQPKVLSLKHFTDQEHFVVKCCLQELLKILKLKLVLDQVRLDLLWLEIGKNTPSTYF